MTVSIKQHLTHLPSQESIEFKRILTAILTDLTAVKTTVANYKLLYDAHVHTSDGNASRTSKPDTGSATGSPSAASAFTDSSSANLVS